MSLVLSIKSIVNTLYPNATFELASTFRANVDSFHLESTELPFIVLDNEIEKNGQIMQNSNLQEATRIVLSFLTIDKKDNNDTNTNALVEAMEAIARRVAVNIYQLERVRPSGNQAYKLTPAIHVYNTNLSGTILDMSVNENLVVNFCPNPES